MLDFRGVSVQHHKKLVFLLLVNFDLFLDNSGTKCIQGSSKGLPAESEKVGIALAEELQRLGAASLLRE